MREAKAKIRATHEEARRRDEQIRRAWGAAKRRGKPNRRAFVAMQAAKWSISTTRVNAILRAAFPEDAEAPRGRYAPPRINPL